MTLRILCLAGMAGGLMLAGCGGGGGGAVNSAPAPPAAGSGGGTSTPTPPPVAINTAITDLQASQTFTSDASSTTVALRSADGIVNATGRNAGTVQVSYDAASRSYTVTTDGRSQSFGPGDQRASRKAGETAFARTGSTNDYLTLVTTPYYGLTGSNRYVGLGYWQRNVVAGGVQTTQFSTFAYGLASPAGAIPRTGGAGWTTDIFGLLTTPGAELRTVQGSGDFNVDFASSTFSAFANLDEFDYIGGGGRVGSLRFRAGGQVDSGNGLSGNMSYASSRVGTLGGTMSGQFYGPGAEEIGASFSAGGGGTGSVLTGALTGRRAATTPATLTLLNVQASERLFAATAGTVVQSREGESGYSQVNAFADRNGQVTITPAGPADTTPDATLVYRPQDADRVDDGRANYTTYRGQLAGGNGPVEVAYYRPGGGNTEIALTYLSFATWSRTAQEMIASGQRIANATKRYILYGLVTPRELLTGRTGSGVYDGVVIASGANRNGALYDVGGTSRFDVDFGNARYSGSLALLGTAADGTKRDFGSFGFGSTINEGEMASASFDNGRNADPFNTINPAFYGPDGQEIGATFRLTTGNPADPASVEIGGITIAKRR